MYNVIYLDLLWGLYIYYTLSLKNQAEFFELLLLSLNKKQVYCILKLYMSKATKKVYLHICMRHFIVNAF